MEIMKIKSKVDSNIELSVTPGHFSSDRFHVNYYIDMSNLKMRMSEAKKVAAAMAKQYIKKVDIDHKYISPLINAETLIENNANVTPIDTIICMDGCEVIGAYLAEELCSSRCSKQHTSQQYVCHHTGVRQRRTDGCKEKYQGYDQRT